MKKYHYKIITVCFWLAVWQILSVVIQEEMLFASPLITIKTLFRLLAQSDFWKVIASSFLRITGGFFLALLAGILLAAFSYYSRLVRELMSPVMKVIQATPVASFIILALIWINSKNLAVLISFLIVLPVVYSNVLRGFLETDRKLLEMARVFNIPFFLKMRYIFLPSVRPYLISAISVGLGLCWKAGVAAEVIGLPANSIGAELYDAKLYLLTPELFAWTFVIILLSMGFEKLVMYLIRRISGNRVKNV
ncbi:ABC transporter permease [Anaerolentibacter hominis]|uniref:ABC transporter permease n=1 Tax=Anaerolentibacter hominis TaxID=3079009 RepID=UPI0031B8851A